MGKGSSSPAPAPTSQTVNQTNLPAWAQPYSEKLLGQAEALTDVNTNPYQQYTGQRVADFTPAQQQAFSSIQNMQTAPQLGQGTDLANASGIGSIAAGQQYGQQATDPSAVSRYMNPYLQNTLNPAMQLLNQQYGIAGQQGQGAATKGGAFGGNRATLANSLNQQNQMLAQNQLVGGAYNQAYNTANQNMQTAAAQGLQGYGQANTAAGTLGQLGQNQYNQQMGIANAQQGVGAQQQAFNQQNLTNKYQDFLNKANYPYQQMGFMSDILHGTPTGGITTTQTAQSAPPLANQIMGYGLGAAGISNLVKGVKEGGVIKGYKEGGAVQHFAGGGITSGMSLEAQFNLAKLMRPQQLDAIAKGQQHSEITAAVAAAALPLATQNQTAASGIEAQGELAQNQGKSVIDRMMEGRQDAVPIPEDQGGIAALNTDNMNDVVQAAEGGIIGYADGGDVKHFQNRGSTDDDAYNRWRKENPFIPDTDAQVLDRRTALEDAFGTAVDTTAAGAKKLNRAVVDPLNALGRFMAAPVTGGLRMFGVNAPSPYPANAANTNAPVGPVPTPDQMQTNQGPYDVGLPASAAAPAATSAPRTNAPRTAAAPQGLELLNANPDALARMQANIDTSRTAAPASAPQGIAAVAPEEAGPPAPKQGSGLGYLDAMNARRTVGFDSIAEAVKQLGMPKSMSDSDKGAAMLEAASAFLTSRTFAEGAGGAGKTIAAKVTALNKTNDEAKRAMLQSQISMETAKMGMEQGDAKMAVDLLNHSSEMAHKEKALKIQEGHWTKQDEAEFAKNEILRQDSLTKAIVGNAEVRLRNAQADVGIPAEAEKDRATARNIKNPNAITPAIRDKAIDNASKVMASTMQLSAWKTKYPNASLPEIRDLIYQSEIERLTGTLTGTRSVQLDQKPGSAEIAGRVVNPS